MLRPHLQVKAPAKRNISYFYQMATVLQHTSEIDIVGFKIIGNLQASSPFLFEWNVYIGKNTCWNKDTAFIFIKLF